MYAISDREDYRASLERRYARFSKMYPHFIRVAIALGVGVPVALVLLLALDAGEKVTLLTVVLLWFVALVVFLVVVESLRDSFERQLNIERMSNERLLRLFVSRNRNHVDADTAVEGGSRVEGAEGPGDVREAADA